MSYVPPADVVENMIAAGTAKAKMAPQDLLIRSVLSGALLGIATTLAFQTNIQFGKSVMGAVIFPVGFVMIVLLGLELLTGNFALVPLAVLQKKATVGELARNWSIVFLGNLLGGVLYAAMFLATTKSGTPVADQIKAVAVAKTVAYEAQGWVGMKQLFFKAMLCNWMVCMGVVMAMTSTTTAGKITAMWLPIMTFFAQGFEHSVVNMFVIPAGMMFGADVSVSQWLVWNQIPVTLGNMVGGFLFVGLALYLTHKKPAPAAELARSPAAAVPGLQTEPQGGIAG